LPSAAFAVSNKNCSETMFAAPLTETEVEQVIKGLRTSHLQVLMKFQLL